MDILKTFQAELSRLGKEVEHLKKENAEVKALRAENEALKRQIASMTCQDLPPLPSANSMAPTEKKIMTYSSIAQANVPKGPAVNAPKTNVPKPTGPMRKLTDMELERFFKGLPLRPARKITAVYLVGPEAGKHHGEPDRRHKTRSIRDIKNMMKEAFDISLGNILHIDFIGRKLMEVHLYEDYVEAFKEKVLSVSKRFTDPWSFVEVDPLDSELLRFSTVMDKKLEAAKRYSARLTRRIATTPSAGHKKFLEKELARCNEIISPSMSSSSPMEVESDPPNQ
jgi:hypothetical protein